MNELRSPENPLAAAVALMNVNRWQDALSLLADARRLQPQTIEPFVRIAQCLNNLERPEEALPVINEGLSLHPESHWALRLRASTLSDLGRHKEAVLDTQRAVEVNPAEPYNHMAHAQALKHVGKLHKAMQHAHKAVELAPYLAEAHNTCGMVALRWHPIQAMRHFEHAIELAPNEPLYHNNLAASLMRQRRFGKAQRVLMNTAESDPSLKIVHRNLSTNIIQYVVMTLLIMRLCSAIFPRPVMLLVLVAAAIYGWHLFRKVPRSVVKRALWDPKGANRFGRLLLGTPLMAFGGIAGIAALMDLLVDHPPSLIADVIVIPIGAVACYFGVRLLQPVFQSKG